MQLDRLKRYLVAQAKEPSTWRGVVLVATALGVSLSPAQREAIVTVGLFVAGVIGAVMPDQKGGTDAE
ncbi:hypothetical protein [Pseudogulbenkiania ferrooxidans]|uniref:Uncharacterized protein n=1 Tax=Pseudogulbenkiania ferrooxidans 2002 TaxID=279714 RepID=B9Z503_9NEIS|nr:hypothetical protein [Pseudogulbenkiania ferrooxidans]EEG08235.1 hypothetical protein FuraDRAFT_2438 [Pseudogulbenkiania ferrooxidans 2002]